LQTVIRIWSKWNFKFYKKKINDSLFNTQNKKNIIEEKLPLFCIKWSHPLHIEHKLDKVYKKQDNTLSLKIYILKIIYYLIIHV
jgi:hypothetical protein